jgi:hypothetical protein
VAAALSPTARLTDQSSAWRMEVRMIHIWFVAPERCMSPLATQARFHSLRYFGFLRVTGVHTPLGFSIHVLGDAGQFLVGPFLLLEGLV